MIPWRASCWGRKNGGRRRSPDGSPGIPRKEEVKPPPREDVSDGDKHAKVALVVVQVAPRVAAA